MKYMKKYVVILETMDSKRIDINSPFHAVFSIPRMELPECTHTVAW